MVEGVDEFNSELQASQLDFPFEHRICKVSAPVQIHPQITQTCVMLLPPRRTCKKVSPSQLPFRGCLSQCAKLGTHSRQRE